MLDKQSKVHAHQQNCGGAAMSCGAGNTACEKLRQIKGVASQLRRDLAISTERVSKMIVKKNYPDSMDVLFAELQQTQFVLRDLLGILDR